ncbi:MAG: DNA recombination protein RmuC [Patescibacteria group bacterium]
MDTLLIFLLLLLAAGLGAFVFIFYRKISSLKADLKNDQVFLMLQQQIGELSKTVDAKLVETHRTVSAQFGISTKIVQDVTEKLTKLDETNKQVMNFTSELQRLQDILQNPKQRGILGEFFLETVLSNVLPPKSFQMQYNLGKNDDGKDLIVDAVIFAKDRLIPIDSKFSLENYNRIVEERNPAEREKLEKLFKQDLKNRIDETSKYILPEKGTMEFAFMFIPSEAIYYDLLINQVGAVKVSTRDLLEYATRDRHVIIVSPTSLLAYLQTVLQGLRAMQIEEQTKDIQKRVLELQKHIVNYDSFMQKLGGHMGTAVNAYNTAYKEFKKIDKDVVKIGGGESTIDPLQIDGPVVE